MASLRLAAGCLLFRLADGFARNALFANQILLFQRLGGLGTNGAQRCAKYLSSACSLAPLLFALLQKAYGLRLTLMALAGGLLQGLCTLLVALAAARPSWRPLNGWLLLAYAVAYGLVVSAMPSLTRLSAPGSFRSGLLQAFVAVLSAGGLLGIAAAALARSYREDDWALLTAVAVQLLGLSCLRAVPKGCAKRVLASALRLEPKHLEPAGRDFAADMIWPKRLGNARTLPLLEPL